MRHNFERVWGFDQEMEQPSFQGTDEETSYPLLIDEGKDSVQDEAYVFEHAQWGNLFCLTLLICSIFLLFSVEGGVK